MLACPKPFFRVWLLTKITSGLTPARPRVLQADEALATAAAAASSRYEALVAAHGSLEAEVHSLQSQLKAAKDEAKVRRGTRRAVRPGGCPGLNQGSNIR